MLPSKTSDEKSTIIDMPELETEESAEQRKNQEGQGLKY